MEMISLKLDEVMLKNVDKALQKHNFSTRTEFIRDSIREKLENLSRDELLAEFMKTSGKAPYKVSDAQLKKTRKQVFDQLAKDLRVS